MQEQIGACFGGGAAVKETVAAARPVVSTSVYETEEGEAVLTWSSASFGLSLRVDLRLPCAAGGLEEKAKSFRLRPWILWKRQGKKKFSQNNLTVEFAWDLRRARFPAGGGPQPAAGFFVSIVVAGGMSLVVGDAAQKRAQSPAAARPYLVSRREHVVFAGAGGGFRTRVRVGSDEKEISVEIRGTGVRVGLDGKTGLRVDQLGWKFRGSEKLDVPGGAARLQVSWDLYRWLFDRRAAAAEAGNTAVVSAASAGELGHAVFVFRLDGGKAEDDAWGLRKARRWGPRIAESSSSSSSSSRGSSSVMEWASGEEEDLHRPDCPTLLVSVWRS
ncbi:uncharacterized protein LOC144704782 [Wolffia australiana]